MVNKRFIIGIVVLAALFVSCTQNAKTVHSENDDPQFFKYESELFSICLPKGWICDDSNWKGLDSMKNFVDMYDPLEIVNIHFVKTFMPFKWKNIEEATEFAKTARAISGDDVELIHQIDSIEIGGYPSSILYYAVYNDNDTTIQKQFVTYLQDSHILVYTNVFFNIHRWDEAQEIGDRIVSTIELKKVNNPLENDSVLRQSINDGIERHYIGDKYLKRGEELMREISDKKEGREQK